MISEISQSQKDKYFVSIDTSVQFSSIQLLSCVHLFVTPCTAAHQAPLSSTVSQSLFIFMSTESEMLSNHFILY